jgi:hypothetical protein
VIIRKAYGKPWLGQAFIATLEIDPDIFEIKQTGTEHHYTVWANCDELMSCMMRVMTIEEAERHV